MARDIPDNANALWRWMHKHRVTLEELAPRVGVGTPYLSSVRRGAAKPSDELKVKLALVTKRIEAERGLAEPHTGVPVEEWFPPESRGTAP